VVYTKEEAVHLEFSKVKMLHFIGKSRFVDGTYIKLGRKVIKELMKNKKT
jgi:hypothetical protein